MMIDMTNWFATAIDKVGDLVDKLGGLKFIIGSIITLILNASKQKIAESLSASIMNMYSRSKAGQKAMMATQKEAIGLMGYENTEGSAGKEAVNAGY